MKTVRIISSVSVRLIMNGALHSGNAFVRRALSTVVRERDILREREMFATTSTVSANVRRRINGMPQRGHVSAREPIFALFRRIVRH